MRLSRKDAIKLSITKWEKILDSTYSSDNSPCYLCIYARQGHNCPLKKRRCDGNVCIAEWMGVNGAVRSMLGKLKEIK